MAASQLGANKHLVDAVGVSFTPRMRESLRDWGARHKPALAHSLIALLVIESAVQSL